MKRKTRGVKISGQQIHCILFANDIVTLSESGNHMNSILRVLGSAFQKFNRNINVQKTKTMFISKILNNGNIKILLNNSEIQQV